MLLDRLWRRALSPPDVWQRLLPARRVFTPKMWDGLQGCVVLLLMGLCIAGVPVVMMGLSVLLISMLLLALPLGLLLPAGAAALAAARTLTRCRERGVLDLLLVLPYRDGETTWLLFTSALAGDRPSDVLLSMGKDLRNFVLVLVVLIGILSLITEFWLALATLTGGLALVRALYIVQTGGVLLGGGVGMRLALNGSGTLVAVGAALLAQLGVILAAALLVLLLAPLLELDWWGLALLLLALLLLVTFCYELLLRMVWAPLREDR